MNGFQNNNMKNNHAKELKALKKLAGIIKIPKYIADEIMEKCNGKYYIKKYW